MSDPTLVYEDDLVRLWHGDARDWLPGRKADAIVTDPPYGDTSLAWDTRVVAWQALAAAAAPQLWCFGSMRFWLAEGHHFREAGWKYAQDIVWEKHNGSGFATDRFKRVHEHAVQWYRGEWSALRHETPTTMVYGPGAHLRIANRQANDVGHTGDIGAARDYETNGERLCRTVIEASSPRNGLHPTQKPLGILRPLIEYSVPPGGLVLDPFAGSGSTLLAARELGRRAEGCEIDADYCAAAVKRLCVLTLEATA